MDKRQDVLTELYQNQYTQLLEMAYSVLHDKYDAEDAVAEVFLNIIRHKVWWEKQNGKIRVEYAEKSCKKICKDFYDKRIKRKQVEYKEEKFKRSIDAEFEKKLLEQENLRELFEILAETDRKVFIARYIDGRSVKDIAKEFNTAGNNISKRLSRGRKALKEYLEEE